MYCKLKCMEQELWAIISLGREILSCCLYLWDIKTGFHFLANYFIVTCVYMCDALHTVSSSPGVRILECIRRKWIAARLSCRGIGPHYHSSCFYAHQWNWLLWSLPGLQWHSASFGGNPSAASHHWTEDINKCQYISLVTRPTLLSGGGGTCGQN